MKGNKRRFRVLQPESFTECWNSCLRTEMDGDLESERRMPEPGSFAEVGDANAGRSLLWIGQFGVFRMDAAPEKAHTRDANTTLESQCRATNRSAQIQKHSC